MENTLDIQQLQHYVDTSRPIHDALGVPQGTPLPLRPFAQGEYNVNFALDVSCDGEETHELLVRVNLGSQMHLDDQIGYEMKALELLAPTGRVPRALFVDGSCADFPYGVGIEQRLAGRALRYETDMTTAAQIFADIHALEVPDGCHLLRPAHPVAAIVEECEAMFSIYRNWPQANEGVLDAVDAMFEIARGIAQRDMRLDAPARVHVVNTEVNSSNFLINEGTTSYLIDWEKPVLGEVEQDLGHFLVPTTTNWKTDTILTRDQVDTFADTYLDAVDGRFDTSGLRERLQGYLVVTCLRGLTWCAMARTEYEGGNRAATNADTYEKICRYLDEDYLAFIARDYYHLF